MSANYDGEIPQPLNVTLRHASMASWMEQKGQWVRLMRRG